ALFPALALTVLGIGANGLGLLYAAPAIGALLGSLLSGWIRRVRRQGMAVVIAIVVWGAAIAGFGLAGRALWIGLPLLALAGAGDLVSAIFRGTILQLTVPDGMRGRMTARPGSASACGRHASISGRAPGSRHTSGRITVSSAPARSRWSAVGSSAPLRRKSAITGCMRPNIATSETMTGVTSERTVRSARTAGPITSAPMAATTAIGTGSAASAASAEAARRAGPDSRSYDTRSASVTPRS